MRIPIGFICSVLGAAVLSYLAIVALIALPSEGPPRWFAVGGITGLSLIVGTLINGISMQNFHRVSQDHREASNRYDILTSRLSPLLYKGLEDVLDRHAGTVEPGGKLNLSAFVLTSDILKMVATTFPPGDMSRQHERKLGEGVTGYFAEAKIAGFAQTTRSSTSANRPVFDRFGEQIGEIPVSSRSAATAGKWSYVRPIYERSTTNPWSSRVVGALMVHSLADQADSLFKAERFHNMVDSIASEVSPYLDAIQVLMGEEK